MCIRDRHEGQRLETYCGSYAYAAPEVILGEPYIGPGADIWSMGVILYAMVVGRLPFKDSDVKTLLSDIASRLTFPAHVQEPCRNLIAIMLCFSPDKRGTMTQIKNHTWIINKNEDREALQGRTQLTNSRTDLTHNTMQN